MNFSIVTPAFNSARWLPLCLASVADQEVQLEHLVQDGGSTDGTLEWMGEREGIRFESARDTGMYDALNRGFKRGTGEICAYLNADEQYLPGALRMVQEHFVRNPETDVAFAHTVCVDADGGFVCHRKAVIPTLDHTLLCHLATLSAAMFFRRRVLDAGHWFDGSLRAAGDVDWVARLLEAGIRMEILPEFTSAFSFTGENLSESAGAEREQRELSRRLPAWRRILRPWVSLRHRIRRWRAGAYRQEAFEYALYVRGRTGSRRVFHTGPRPSWRWPG